MWKFLLLTVLLSPSCLAYSDFEEAMRADEERGHFPMEGRGMDLYPFGHLGQAGSITIEQFVKELQKRKEAKKVHKDPVTKVLEQKKVVETPKSVVGNQNKNIKQSTPSKKGSNQSPSINATKKKPGQSPSSKRKTPKRPRRKPATNKRKKNVKQTTGPRKVSEKKQPVKTPLVKPDVKTPLVKPAFKVPVAAKPETKPSTNKKPLKKTKNKVAKQETAEDDDPFNFSNAQQHSDHHVHHHDHLEAHKHHHKHKESHAHEHAHSNDHVHNHKHTHNHVHNHIHKHNEAHEHAAEHTHTEKHTHKHLEYIDQGGWRRRDQDPYGMILEEPTELVLQEREGRDNPRGQVKTELQNFINSFKKAYSAGPERQTQAQDTAPEYEPLLEQDILPHSSDTFSEPTSDQRLNHRTDDGFSRNSEKAFFESSPTFSSIPGVSGVSPLENKSDYPVEVEEISYEEYLRLQKKGPTFEEALNDYSDYQAEHTYDDRFEDSYGPVDQVSYSSEEHVIAPGEFGDWVDMDLDLQYDLGPEYVDYQELERRDEDGEDLEDIADYEEYLDMLETEMRMKEMDPEVTDDKEPEPVAEDDSVDTETSGDTPDPAMADLYSLDYRNFV